MILFPGKSDCLRPAATANSATAKDYHALVYSCGSNWGCFSVAAEAVKNDTLVDWRTAEPPESGRTREVGIGLVNLRLKHCLSGAKYCNHLQILFESRGVGIHQYLLTDVRHLSVALPIIFSFPFIFTLLWYSPNVSKCAITTVRTSPFSKRRHRLNNGKFPARHFRDRKSISGSEWGSCTALSLYITVKLAIRPRIIGTKGQ
jgi:hypothetical protein